MHPFDHRDAFADYAHVPSQPIFEAGPAADSPVITIAIPTFKRPELLLECVDSVMRQAGDLPALEVVIIDNDPERAGVEAFRAGLPKTLPHPLRYLGNSENIGLFGNWNRCIEMARGEWVTILNDDDILRPAFVSTMMDIIRKRPDADGIVARKDYIDRRQHLPRDVRITSRMKWLAELLTRMRFDKDGLAKPNGKTTFFVNELSNGLAFLFKRDVGMSLGGYYVEDWPSSDYYFYVRFFKRFNLYWTYHVLGDIGLGENESMRPETLAGFVIKDQQLRQALLAEDVPAQWDAICPQLVSNALARTKRHWGVSLDADKLAQDLDMVLPPPNFLKVRLFRMLNGGL